MTPRTAAKHPSTGYFPQRGQIRRSMLRILVATVVAAALYGIAGFLGGPWLLERWVSERLTSQPNQRAAYAAARFNPFTLVGEIVGFETGDAATGAAFAADRISLSLGVSSLFERRWVVGAVFIERPRIEARSFSELLTAGRAVRAALLSRARIDRLVMNDGRLSVDSIDVSRFDVTVAAFDAQSDNAGTFSLQAQTASAATLAIDGSIAPGLEEADGRLRMSAIDIAAIAQRLGGTLAAADPAGRIDIEARMRARALLGEPVMDLTDARLEFHELALMPTTQLLVTAQRLSATANIVLTASDATADLRGRLEADDAEFVIADSRVQPSAVFVLDDAALLANADDDGLALVLGGRMQRAGATTVNIRVPNDDAPRRIAIESADIPAALLSAYSEDALGRPLSSGRIDIGLEYGLNGGRSDGALHIAARNLAFAGGAANAGGVGPSLELASALLEDAEGTIELDLRFATNTGTVSDAVTDALTARIATVTQTPFDTLADFIDGADQSSNAVPFLPGDAALNDRAQASVAALADALAARPRLGLRVYAGYDASVDRDALARQQIELHVQLATAGPSNRARPAPVDFSSERSRDVLDEFAGERLPAERVAELAERFECDGALAQVCRRAYYEQIFDALVANEEIEPRTLSRLGRFRAQSIVDTLRQRGIAESRIELVGSADGSAVETPFGVGLPVELTALDGAAEG